MSTNSRETLDIELLNLSYALNLLLKNGYLTISLTFFPDYFFRSSGHFSACLSATTARLGAALTVIHILLATLFRTPVTDICAQLANLFGKRAVAGNRIGAQSANRRALDAAGRTVIFACLAAHVRETIAALSCAVVTGGDAVLRALVQMIIHSVPPWVDCEMQLVARKNNYPVSIGCEANYPVLQDFLCAQAYREHL